MKKSILALTTIVFVLFFLSMGSFAQQKGKYNIHQKKNKIFSSNLVKVNLSSFVLRNTSLQYETPVSGRISLAMGVRFMPNGGLPLRGVIKNYMNARDSAVNRLLEESRLGNFAITPELRFYVGRRKAPFGFYIASFLRYGIYNATLPFDYDSQNGKKYTALARGTMSSLTGGFLLGAQWYLGSHIFLDWYILGPHYGLPTGYFEAPMDLSGLSSQEQKQFEQDINNSNIPLIKLNATVDNSGVKMNVNGSIVGIRGLGINIGYRF